MVPIFRHILKLIQHKLNFYVEKIKNKKFQTHTNIFNCNGGVPLKLTWIISICLV